MDNYGQLHCRMMELMPYNFIDVYNKFAVKRITEDTLQNNLQHKKYSRHEFETLMMLIASYMYFKDDITIFEVFNYKTAFIMHYPEYIINNKHRITVYIHEAYHILKKPYKNQLIKRYY